MSEKFEAFYNNRFGESWGELKNLLQQPKSYIDLTMVPKLIDSQNLDQVLAPFITSALPEDCYGIDPASLFPALELGHFFRLQKDLGPYLDMCAAPGGKALAFLYAQEQHTVKNLRVQFNERSPERAIRLKKNIERFAPVGLLQNVQELHYSRFDGRQFGLHRPNFYQGILLDAPCSSERHVLQSPVDLLKWTPKRVKQIALDQFSLLASAFDALKPGGMLVYATCALLAEENECQVEKLLTKRPTSYQLFPHYQSAKIKALPFGQQVLTADAGPIFYALIGKKE